MWIVPSNHPLHQSLSDQVFLESKEELNELSDLTTSLMWRSKPLSLKIWSRKWSAVYWIRLLFGRTVRHSRVSRFEESLTSYLQATHVSHFQQQVSEEERKTPGIYIPTLKGQFGLFDHEYVSLRTSEDTSHAASLQSSPRWRDWVIECIGEYTQRRKLARRIREKGCSFSQWKTPIANQCGRTRADFTPKLHQQVLNWGTPRVLSNNWNGSTNHPEKKRLEDMVMMNWPTPTAMNPNEMENPEKWRARRDKIKAKKINGNGFGMSLGQAVKWGTPTARDYKDGSAESVKNTPENGLLGRMVHSSKYHDPASLNRHGNIRGSYPERLNPLWVCQLMGITFEKTFFVHLETPSTKTPPNSPSGTLSENMD